VRSYWGRRESWSRFELYNLGGTDIGEHRDVGRQQSRIGVRQGWEAQMRRLHEEIEAEAAQSGNPAAAAGAEQKVTLTRRRVIIASSRRGGSGGGFEI